MSCPDRQGMPSVCLITFSILNADQRIAMGQAGVSKAHPLQIWGPDSMHTIGGEVIHRALGVIVWCARAACDNQNTSLRPVSMGATRMESLP